MAILISLGLFFSAVIIHEFSHAYVASLLGDQTAKKMGRLTLNPLAHIDPFGTLLLPLLLIVMRSPILFGWAKPVPINFAGLNNPKKDMIWVGIAGPGSNLIFASLVALILKINAPGHGMTTAILMQLVLINVVLAVFNLIPIPPLDGSRVLMGLLPARWAMPLARLERYGIFILFALLYMGLFDRIVWPITKMILKVLL